MEVYLRRLQMRACTALAQTGAPTAPHLLDLGEACVLRQRPQHAAADAPTAAAACAQAPPAAAAAPRAVALQHAAQQGAAAAADATAAAAREVEDAVADRGGRLVPGGRQVGVLGTGRAGEHRLLSYGMGW